MTGHGNVVLMTDSNNLKIIYLLAGGFLHIDDNYGMNQYIRKEIKKFPNNELVEIPATHAIFQNHILSQMDYQKFMNTMVNDHKLLVFYS
jgi:hypothetical protein